MNTSDPPLPSTTRAGLIARGSFILAVDDDPLVRQLIETILVAQNWSVKCAASADEAFAVIDAAPVSPVIAICDVIMKDIDGLELARLLMARVPRLRVIFVSGHLEETSWWPKDLRGCPFLAKPFTNEDLIGAVREALSS